MLVLTRRPGETLIIEPRPETAASEFPDWFSRPIEVRILRVEGNHVRVGIDAADGLQIRRGERSSTDR